MQLYFQMFIINLFIFLLNVGMRLKTMSSVCIVELGNLKNTFENPFTMWATMKYRFSYD